LLLSESYLQWDETTAARKELKDLDLLWPKARTNFTGAAWKQNWEDWTVRRAAAQDKADRLSGAKSGIK